MDRRFLAAIGLMMLVVLAPMVFFKRPATPATTLDSIPTLSAPDSAPQVYRPGVPSPAPTGTITHVAPAGAPDDTVMVRSGLYEYAVSTRGARIVGARLLRYHSMARGDTGGTVDLVRPGDGLFAMTLVTGGDTLPLRDWIFTPSQAD